MRNPSAEQQSGAPEVSDARATWYARSSRSTRLLATVALVGAVLYVLVDVVLQLLPPHYSVISEAESNLAVGPYGWIMNLNFLARGGALASFGPRSRLRQTGLGLMLFAGVCSAALAFLPTDIPPSDAPGLAPTTALGAAHLVVAAAGFIAALIAFGALTWWLRGTALRAAFPAAVTLTGVAAAGLVSLGVSAVLAPGVIGLAERVCLAGVLGWVIVVSVAVRRRTSAASAPASVPVPAPAPTPRVTPRA